MSNWQITVCGLVVAASIANLVSVGLYWIDKRAARGGGRRIAENTLHFWALAGGWPGALWARGRFRHKTQKQPFSAVLWLTVAAHLVGSGLLLWWLW